MANDAFEGMLNKRFDHNTYCLRPKSHALQTYLTVNDELPNRIATGYSLLLLLCKNTNITHYKIQIEHITQHSHCMSN